MDGKPHGKISSRHFPKKPTESVDGIAQEGEIRVDFGMVE
jgi:hypothetical protein